MDTSTIWDSAPTGDPFIIQTGILQIELERAPLRIRYRDSTGRVLAEEPTGREIVSGDPVGTYVSPPSYNPVRFRILLKKIRQTEIHYAKRSNAASRPVIGWHELRGVC